MTRVLNSLPESSRLTRYPWDLWMDGRVHLAERGVDYETSDESFRRVCHQHAAAAGMTAVTRLHEDGMAIQFSDG